MSAYSKQNGKIVKIKNFYIKQGNKILSAKELWTKVNNQMVKVYSALNPGILLKKPDYSTLVSIPSGTYFADEDIWISARGNDRLYGDLYVSRSSDMSDGVKLFYKAKYRDMFRDYIPGGNLIPIPKGYYYKTNGTAFYKINTLLESGGANEKVCCKNINPDTGVTITVNTSYYADKDCWLYLDGRAAYDTNGVDVAISEDSSFSTVEIISPRGLAASTLLYIPKGLYYKYTQTNTTVIKFDCQEKTV